jgi:hypothetical protein
MTVDEMLAQLEEDLHAGKVSVRREAVERAAKLLKQRGCQEPCRERIDALLWEAAAQDVYPSVREAAFNVVSNLNRGYDPLWGPDDRKHMVRVECPKCGTSHYFDRRKVCTDQRPVYRSVVRGADGRELDEILEVCSHCGVELKFRVDCGEYR